MASDQMKWEHQYFPGKVPIELCALQTSYCRNGINPVTVKAKFRPALRLYFLL